MQLKKKNRFLKIPGKFNNVNMDGNSHNHKQIGQECLEKGSCDYGCYAYSLYGFTKKIDYIGGLVQRLIDTFEV